MTVQQNVFQTQERSAAAGSGPHPVSLETMELIEQALAQMLSSLRRGAPDAAAQEAGRIEYDSWFPGTH